METNTNTQEEDPKDNTGQKQSGEPGNRTGETQDDDAAIKKQGENKPTVNDDNETLGIP